jgi:hypothetical protein
MNDSESDIRRATGAAPGGAPPDVDRGIELRQMLIDGFRGKMRWATLLLWIYALAGTAVAVFAAVRFFAAEAVRDVVLYAALFLAAAGLVTCMKMCYWMLINRNTVLREIRWLELRVAELAGKIK